MSRPALRAPTASYGLLLVPSREEIPPLLEENAIRLDCDAPQLLDMPLSQLREQARAESLSAAQNYMARLGLPPVPSAGQGFIVTGHQPELFHPGVWIKNFAASSLGQQHQRIGVNLIVDSDLVKANSIRVPDQQGNRHQVPFDAGPLQVPYEDRPIAAENLFRDFPAAVAATLGPVPWQPLLLTFWPQVLAAADRTKLLGERFTIGRHWWEVQQGCHNLELPLSRVCATRTFAHFAVELLTNLLRFHQVHNDSLEEFRRRHRIRSRHHPVPALAEIDGWREMPFWVWRADQPRRARLFAQETASGLQLGLLDRQWQPLGPRIPPQRTEAVQAWQDLAHQGWKIRSRALTTTLFARLFLADLFLHGIGGGIYDELTDALIERYYRLKPPAFLVLSGTLRLPWLRENTAVPAPAELQQRLRNLEYHPEDFLSPADAELQRLEGQKRAWRAKIPQTKEERHEQFLALKQLTATMSQHLRGQQQQTAQALEQARHAAQQWRWLQDREYAYCLYPEQELQKLFAPFLDK
jgi:hypothetical protein